MNDEAMFPRRDVLLGLGVAAGATATVGPANVAAALASPASSVAASADAAPVAPAVISPLVMPARCAEVDSLFGTVGAGTTVGDATVVAVHGLRNGAIPVVLERSGDRFAIEIFREEEGGAPPVVRAAGLSLFMVNDGTGFTPTHEGNGVAVMALGRLLAARRGGGAPIPRELAGRSTRDVVDSREIPLH